MLAQDDVPFGVRALERGIEVEGIWISNSNTPVQTPSQTPRQSETPNTIRSLSSSLALNSSQIQEEVPVTSPGYNDIAASCVSLPPLAPAPIHSEADVFREIHYTYESQRPGGVYSPLLSSTSPNSPSKFSRRSNIVTPADKRASFHTRVLCGRQLSDLKSRASLTDLDETESSSASNDTSTPAPVEQQASRMASKLCPSWQHLHMGPRYQPCFLHLHRTSSKAIVGGIQTQDECNLQRKNPYDYAERSTSVQPITGREEPQFSEIFTWASALNSPYSFELLSVLWLLIWTRSTIPGKKTEVMLLQFVNGMVSALRSSLWQLGCPGH